MVTVDHPHHEYAVNEDCSVELILRSDDELTPGDTVEWQYPHTWIAVSHGAYPKPLQQADPLGPHFVTVTAPEATFDIDIRERNQYDEDQHTRLGRHIIGTLVEGTIPAGAPIRLVFDNTTAPYLASRESVWLRVNGESPDEVPTLITRGKSWDKTRVIAPSSVAPDSEFRLLIGAYDEFDNRAEVDFEDITLELANGDIIAEGIDFTGSTRIPVSLSETGIHRFRVNGTLSNPIRVTEEPQGPYWGDIHVHADFSHDGMGRNPYEFARDVTGLDFAATAEHIESLGSRSHELSLTRTETANDPGTFVTIPAYEITLPSERGGGSHYNFYFRSIEAYRNHFSETHKQKSDKPSPETDVNLVVDPESLDDAVRPSPEDMILIPHHTGITWGTGGQTVCDPTDLEADTQCPLIEIYSKQGQSEYYAPEHALAYEFNRYRRDTRRVNSSVPGPYYAQDFWMAGHRLGAIASSDEHTGKGGRPNSGIAGVFAADLDRESIFDGLRSRHCYGTTGERILLDFTAEGTAMGEVKEAAVGSSVSFSIDVWGTDRLLKVEVLRHRFGSDEGFRPVLRELPSPAVSGPGLRSETLDASFQFTDEITGECMYYARVVQAPVERPAMAWSSPIWIDPASED